VGHSNRSLAELVAILEAHRIEDLVDVRTIRRSRRNPQFEEAALAEGLSDRGIVYAPLPALGGMRRPRPGSRHQGLTDGGLRGYADHMETAQFEAGLRQLFERAAGRRTAVMCAEADYRRCHRSLLSDAVTVRGWQVVHLIDTERSESHRLTREARVIMDGQDSRLSYPAVQGTLFDG
jgi:uncharacterized protein (DUF488 family)